MIEQPERKADLRAVQKVDNLSEEVKLLALNLAIYLAKAKDRSGDLSRLEPDFVRLVNGTVKVVQELTAVVQAARNTGAMVHEPPTGNVSVTLMEARLRSILDQCAKIMSELSKRIPT
jgi:hypothetical protein